MVTKVINKKYRIISAYTGNYKLKEVFVVLNIMSKIIDEEKKAFFQPLFKYILGT